MSDTRHPIFRYDFESFGDYGLPALMKKYIDDVFAHGFAYGSTGTYLKDKTLIVSFTTGGPESDYRYDGEQRYPVEDFLLFLKNLAWYCGMHWGGWCTAGINIYSWSG